MYEDIIISLLSTVIVRKDIMSVMLETTDVLYQECMQILKIVHTSRSVALFFPLIFLYVLEKQL